jgi:hypothetical protein
MVLVLRLTSSSSMTILLTLCFLLLDRCTSLCLQEHLRPAPLPVPLCLCLGRPRLLLVPPTQLPVTPALLRCPHSTSRLCYRHRGLLPRHARHQDFHSRAMHDHDTSEHTCSVLAGLRPARLACERWSPTRVPASTPGAVLPASLLPSTSATVASSFSCPNCTCTGRPTSQGCHCCASCGKPARHDDACEERLSDACRAEDLPRRLPLSKTFRSALIDPNW